MIISLITAAAENNVIGIDGDLPWRLPNDMKFFKNTTQGHVVIMGRKTLESFGNPLSNRTNIVITRNRDYQADKVITVGSLEEALQMAREKDPDEIFVIGGAEIYRQALPIADRIYLTRVHATPEGDTHFPEFDRSAWELIHEDAREADERHQYAYTFQTFSRKK